MSIQEQVLQQMVDLNYPLDRVRRMEDLVKWNALSEAALGGFFRFNKRFGCIAYDLGIFPHHNAISLTWNVYIASPKDGGRRKNSVIMNVIIESADGFTFQAGWEGGVALLFMMESDAAAQVIDAQRTLRPDRATADVTIAHVDCNDSLAV